MRVTILTHYYRPEVGAPQARLYALAARLAERGVEVTVHTGFPHYPDGRVQPPYRNRLWLEEREGSTRVVRSLVYPAANRGFARRLADHLVFAASATATAGRTRPADAVVVETPPLFTAAAGVLYARRVKAPLLLHVSDRWPESAVQLGALRNRGAIALAERLERRCYRHAAVIVAPTEGLRAELGALPEAAGKVARLGPAVDTGAFTASPPPQDGGPLRVLYAGTIGLAQGIGTLVEAARLAGPAVEIRIAGDGAEAPALRERLAREPLANVKLLGRVAHAEVPGLLADSHVAAVLLRDRPLFEGALPTKLLEAMAGGRPVVLSARGEAARLVEESGAGLVVAPERPEELAAALGELARDRGRLEVLGERARACAEAHDWAPVADAWAALLHGLVPFRYRVDTDGGGH